MFETAELSRSITKDDYKKREPALRIRLLALQARLRETKFPVLVLVNGVDGAGKGDAVNLLLEWLDPRFIRTVAGGAPTEEERDRPEYWRHWRSLAPRGQIGIYFGNWYTQPILDRVYKTISRTGFESALTRIGAFERGLVEDGALIVKLWFHLSMRAQKERLDMLLSKRRTQWRVSEQDLENHTRYDRFCEVSEGALRETSTGVAPWTIVECTDSRYRDITVGEALCTALEERLDQQEAGPDPTAHSVPKAAPKTRRRASNEPTILDMVEQGEPVDDDTYADTLEDLQGRLNRGFRTLKKNGGSVTAVFEGWDAAGKGGAIRRVTAALDARDYRVIPVAAPTDEEKAHHYLWRFWRHLPGRGHMTIYDRSWYGRVLVERVENFAREEEWLRAYGEINEFEEQLVEHGIVVAKLWLHIDPAEQLRRFKEREATDFKRHKITEEDYRNRARRTEYELAVHDMIEKTSTDIAPWRLVAANDKRGARLDVLRVLCESVEKAT